MKNKNCCIKEALFKASDINYKNLAKYLILIPVLLIAFAIMFTSIFGINRQADIRDRYEFVVDFGTQISTEEQGNYEEKISEALEGQELTAVKFVKYGQSEIYSGLRVTIDPSVSDLTVEQLEDIKNALETDLQASIANTVEVSDINLVQTDLKGNAIYALIALAIILVAVFVYVWIRFNLSFAFASVVMGLFAPAMTFVIFGLFRLPFDGVSFAVMLIASILSAMIFMHIADNIRNQEIDNQSLINNDYIKNANNSIINAILYPFIGLTAFLLLLTIIMLFVNIGIAFTLISVIFMIFVVVYSSMIVATSFWANIYNKDKDQRLKSRLDRLSKEKVKKQKKSDKDDQDKVMV